MAEAEGMAVVACGVICSPVFMDSVQQCDDRKQQLQMDENEVRLRSVLQAIADEKKVSPVCIGLAYVMQKQPYVFPLIPNPSAGALQECMGALTVALSKTDVARIEKASPLQVGFPLDLLSWHGREAKPWLPRAGGHIDFVPHQEPIIPRSQKPQEPSF